MIKEIYEEPCVLEETLKESKHSIKVVANEVALRFSDLLYVIGSGTSYHAGLSFQYAVSKLMGFYPTVIPASEFISWLPEQIKQAVLIAISQSGESIDVIRAVRASLSKGIYVVGVTNNSQSTLANIAHTVLLTHAGEERALAATKTYSAQLFVLSMLATELAYISKTIDIKTYRKLMNSLNNAPTMVENVISQVNEIIKEVAMKFVRSNNIFILGSGSLYPLALEGALKIKETCNMFSEGFALREFLHGPMQLIGPETLIIVLAHREFGVEPVKEVISKLKSFDAPIMLINDAQITVPIADVNISLPKFPGVFSPIIYVPVLQLFAYYLSVLRGLDPDKPTKLSKVVK